MSRIVISWDYGMRLLDKDYLVSELIRLKDELANFNWDYMLVPSLDGGTRKIKDPDRIDNHYDWLSKAVPELEKMCKERGIDFEMEAARMKPKLLATRLNDFYKNFDFYDYTDKVEGTEQDVIVDIVAQLNDFTAADGILKTLKEIKEESELNSEQAQILDKLINDVEVVLSSFGKSVDAVISDASERSEKEAGKDFKAKSEQQLDM